MADWGIFSGSNRYQSQTLVLPTCGLNSKGSWAQVTASLPFEVCGVVVQWRGNACTSFRALIDVGIGAAGAEQVIIPNLAGGNVSSTEDVYNQPIIFPVEIPAGTRVAVRGSSNFTLAGQVSIGFIGSAIDSLPVFNRITDYGTDAASSSGTFITMPSSGTGSWVQLAASTADAIRMLGIMVVSNSATNNIKFKVDVGVRVAGSELVLLSQLNQKKHTNTRNNIPQHLFWFPVDIPAGTRLATHHTKKESGVSNFYVSLMGAR